MADSVSYLILSSYRVTEPFFLPRRLLNSLISCSFITQSALIPTLRHFLYRQNKQFFRFLESIWHFSLDVEQTHAFLSIRFVPRRKNALKVRFLENFFVPLWRYSISDQKLKLISSFIYCRNFVFLPSIWQLCGRVHFIPLWMEGKTRNLQTDGRRDQLQFCVANGIPFERSGYYF